MPSNKLSAVPTAPPMASLPADRIELARTSGCEISALAAMLAREADGENSYEILRGTLNRIHDLASIVMSVTGGDDGRATEEMQHVVHGLLFTDAHGIQQGTQHDPAA